MGSGGGGGSFCSQHLCSNSACSYKHLDPYRFPQCLISTSCECALLACWQCPLRSGYVHSSFSSLSTTSPVVLYCPGEAILLVIQLMSRCITFAPAASNYWCFVTVEIGGGKSRMMSVCYCNESCVCVFVVFK